jgi:hypothetical protein
MDIGFIVDDMKWGPQRERKRVERWFDGLSPEDQKKALNHPMLAQTSMPPWMAPSLKAAGIHDLKEMDFPKYDPPRYYMPEAVRDFLRARQGN